MENFKVTEYSKDYVAVQKEYFSDLREVTEPIEKDGKLTSIVLLNGEEYEKTDWIKDNLIHILLLPIKTYQISPVIEFIANDKLISIETYKIVKEILLENKQYVFSTQDNEKEVFSYLTTEYFDISDELDDERYVFKFLLEKGLEGKTSKTKVGEKTISARRNEKAIGYLASIQDELIDKKILSNENTSLFELLSSMDKQIAPKNKTK